MAWFGRADWLQGTGQVLGEALVPEGLSPGEIGKEISEHRAHAEELARSLTLDRREGR